MRTCDIERTKASHSFLYAVEFAEYERQEVLFIINIQNMTAGHILKFVFCSETKSVVMLYYVLWRMQGRDVCYYDHYLDLLVTGSQDNSRPGPD